MSTVLQFRNGTALEWSTSNPILSEGELGLEINTGKFKIGNGVTAWNDLALAGIQGAPGTDYTIALNVGTIAYFSSTAPVAGWLRCDGSEILSASYPTLVPVLPEKPGFSGVGAQYGPLSVIGGTVSAISYLAGINEPTAGIQNVDDGRGTIDGDQPVWHSGYNMPGVWLKFSFNGSVVIDHYYMSDRVGGSWSPTAWTFEGSNNDVDWTTIHTVDNGTSRLLSGLNGIVINTSNMYEFAFTNTTAYSSYRWVFTNNNYGYGYIALAEVALVGPPTASDPTIRILPKLAAIPADNVTLYPFIKY